MARVMVLLYLIALLVRPQDWFGPLLGLPTTVVITLPMFLGGLAVYLANPEKYRVPHNWLLPSYVFFITVVGNTS